MIMIMTRIKKDNDKNLLSCFNGVNKDGVSKDGVIHVSDSFCNL